MRWSELPRVSQVCAVIGVALLCCIVWIDIALARRSARRVDDGVVEGVLTIFLGPTAILFVLAGGIGARRESAARVLAFCGVLWPVVMEVAYFAAFTFY